MQTIKRDLPLEPGDGVSQVLEKVRGVNGSIAVNVAGPSRENFAFFTKAHIEALLKKGVKTLVLEWVEEKAYRDLLQRQQAEVQRACEALAAKLAERFPGEVQEEAWQLHGHAGNFLLMAECYSLQRPVQDLERRLEQVSQAQKAWGALCSRQMDTVRALDLLRYGLLPALERVSRVL